MWGSAEPQQEGAMLAAGVRSRHDPSETCHHRAQLRVWVSLSGLHPAPVCLARRYTLSRMGLCWRMELGPGAVPQPQPSPCSRMPSQVPPSLLQRSGMCMHLAPTLCSQASHAPSTA